MTTPVETTAPQDAPQAPQSAPQAPPAPPVDPAAPYGRTPGGRPRRKPLTGKRGRPKGSGTGRRQRTSVIGASGSARRPQTKAPDYRPAILRAAGLLTVPLAFRSPIDAATIDAHLRGADTPENPGLARALSNLAVEEPRVAAVLDRLMTAGPYAEVIGCALPLALQLLTNHRKIPLSVGQRLGAVDPDVIAEQLAAEAAQMAAEAA